jgi:hypothetical protein
MISSLVWLAAWALWRVGYFESVQVCINVPMPGDHGCEVVSGYFHLQPFGNYRKVVFCIFALG